MSRRGARPPSAPTRHLLGDLLGGPFGRAFARHVAGRSTTFAFAGLALFFAFDLLEAANADGRTELLHTLRRAPEVLVRVGKIALVMGGVAAVARVLRTAELLPWFAAGGSPLGLAAGAGIVGAVAAIIPGVLPTAAQSVFPPAIGRTDAMWLRTPGGFAHLKRVRADTIDHAFGIDVVDGAITVRWSAARLRWTGTEWRAGRFAQRRWTANGTETSSAIEAVVARVPPPTSLARSHSSSRSPWRVVEPLAWSLMAVLGVGLALAVLGIRTHRTGLVVLTLAGLSVYLLDEFLAAFVDAGLLAPAGGAMLAIGLPVVATVTVWRRVLIRGLRD